MRRYRSLCIVAALTAVTWYTFNKDHIACGQTLHLLDSNDATVLARAGNGDPIAVPMSRETYLMRDGERSIAVPKNMVYIPAGYFVSGTGYETRRIYLDAYCIGKFDVTNCEYKAFLDATGNRRFPRYWSNGTYPSGKAAHPVVYVSLDDAKAYAAWVSQVTGWTIGIPTSQQWERAARGTDGSIWPWGNSPNVSCRNGELSTPFNYNAVTIAYYLSHHPKMPVYYAGRLDDAESVTVVEKITTRDQDGNLGYLGVDQQGNVRGWENHRTGTGFIYTDLFQEIERTGGNTNAVGSYAQGKSACGCYDLAGNVWNWCDTVITARTGAENGRPVNEIRGGSWYSNGAVGRSTYTGECRAGQGAYHTVGFRITMLPRGDIPPK